MSSFDSERSTEYECEITSVHSVIIRAISQILSSIISRNKALYNYISLLNKQSVNLFNAKYPPVISICDYLERIVQYSKIEEETLTSALIYIDHLCNETHIMLTEYNVHRILFTACLLSIKYNEDEIFNMEYYAQICGVKTKELHRLESFFCDSLHFQLYISEEEFLKYQQYLYNENKVDSKDTILMEYEGDVSMLLYHTS